MEAAQDYANEPNVKIPISVIQSLIVLLNGAIDRIHNIPNVDNDLENVDSNMYSINLMLNTVLCGLHTAEKRC